MLSSAWAGLPGLSADPQARVRLALQRHDTDGDGMLSFSEMEPLLTRIRDIRDTVMTLTNQVGSLMGVPGLDGHFSDLSSMRNRSTSEYSEAYASSRLSDQTHVVEGRGSEFAGIAIENSIAEEPEESMIGGDMSCMYVDL